MIKSLLKWTATATAFVLSSSMMSAQNHRCGFDDKHEHLLKTDVQYKSQLEKIEKQWMEYVADDNNPKKIVISGTDTVYEIPIVVHVVHTGGAIGTIYNPTDTRIESWVEYTNQVLAGTAPGYVGPGAGGTNIGVRLVLAKRTPDCTPTNGIIRVDGSVIPDYVAYGVGDPGVDEDDLFALSRWSPSDYYNIYVVNKIDGNDGTSGSFTAGYAYLPPASPAYDGSVMLATIADWGESTFAHELGHALGLYHTFQGGGAYPGSICSPTETMANCATVGDRVCDTEPSTGLLGVWPCPTNSTTNPCTGTFYQGVQYNVMNYSNCPDRFTPGQRERAIYMLLLHRNSLIESNGLLEPPAPGDEITAVATCDPTSITNPSNSFASGPTRVRLESIDNTSEPYRPELLNFHEDYSTQTCLKDYVYTDLIKGESYDLLIDLYLNTQHMSVFFDFNGDGIFDPDTERVYLAYSAAGTRTVNFTVPMDAVENTYVKMRIKTELATGSATLPCTDPTYGQVEDYAVRFLLEPLSGNANQLKAQSQDCAIHLHWNITDEHFAIETIELQRSQDGQNYETIEHFFVGKNNDVRNYTDMNVVAGNYFYRLKMNNVANKESYTHIAKVSHECQNGFTVFPNPTSGTLIVQYAAAQDQIATIDVYDIVGKQVKTISLNARQGINHHEIDLSSLAQGLYIIKLTQDNQTNFTKVNVVK